jgi:uncharacterized protein YcfJ
MFAVVALAASSFASAQYSRGHAPEFDYAEVISVDPIVNVVQQPVSRNECWNEPVRYREPVRYQPHRSDRAPAVLAGIVGGVLGNQFGHGRGRDAATAAGAVLGYSLARDSQRHHSGGYYSGGREYQTYERRCSTRTEYYRDEQVEGYDVAYRYNGRVYHTVTDYHPGDRIQVEVSVNAIH